MKVNTNRFNAQLSVHPAALRVLRNLQKSPRLKAAMRVIAPSGRLVSIKAAAWYNGRERGIVVWLEELAREDMRRFCVIFGESRSSDLVFVDCGNAPFDLNPPCRNEHVEHDWYEGAWMARRSFAPGPLGEAEAADYAADRMANSLEGGLQ